MSGPGSRATCWSEVQPVMINASRMIMSETIRPAGPRIKAPFCRRRPDRIAAAGNAITAPMEDWRDG